MRAETYLNAYTKVVIDRFKDCSGLVKSLESTKRIKRTRQFLVFRDKLLALMED